MNVFMKKAISLVLVLVAFTLVLAGCEVSTMPSVSIGLKQTGSAGEYNESLQELEVEERFYGVIKIKMITDSQEIKDYKVVVELPKTKEVEVNRDGGLKPDSQVEENGKTILNFTVKGSKEATHENIHFTGVPFEKGTAVITVMIYDENGVAVNSGYDKTIYFD